MKERLKKYSRQRLRFVGTVSRFGSKRAPSGRTKRPTVLLLDVHLYSTKESVAEHVWLIGGKWSKNLRVGDVVVFQARVTRYQKGYKGVHGREEIKPIQDDYRLEKPAFVKILRHG